jgi:hypothetical protein
MYQVTRGRVTRVRASNKRSAYNTMGYSFDPLIKQEMILPADGPGLVILGKGKFMDSKVLDIILGRY